MKSKITSAIILFFLVFYLGNSFGSTNINTDFSITVRNFVQTTDRTFEFDIYLADTDLAQPFELASVQCGIMCNPAIYTGGTISASVVTGTSGLNAAQTPVNIAYLSGSEVIRIAANVPPGTGNGTVIQAITPGTKVIRIKVTSTVAFATNSKANLAFVSNTAVLPLYPTRVAVYIAGVNTQLSVIPGINAVVLENPALNSTMPVAYTVTGGGTYCQGGSGLPVGLANSQSGVNYTLYLNGTAIGSPVPGTGSGFNFPGNQVAGSYSVTGTNSTGTTQMTNNVMVMMNPTPVVTTGSNSPVCGGSTLSLTSSPTGLATYKWSGPNSFTSGGQNPTVSNAQAIASGTYTVTVTNSYNCPATSNVLVTVYQQPAVSQTLANITVASGQSVCKDAQQLIVTGGNGTAYTVSAGGSSLLVAGQKINMLPGTIVQRNGYLRAYIELACVYCNLQKNGAIAEPQAAEISRESSVMPETIKSGVKVYPNPTSGLLNIELTGTDAGQDAQLSLISLAGNLLLSQNSPAQQTHHMNLESLQAGLYLLHITTKNQDLILKVIKHPN